jgi:energy-converting hydrogenase Eha subunit H
MLNFILIPLFLFLVSISLLFTVYFLYNRWVQEIDFQYPKFKLYIYLEIFNTANIQLTSTWMI